MLACWRVLVVLVQLLHNSASFELLYPENGTIIFANSLQLDVEVTEKEEFILDSLNIQVISPTGKQSLSQSVKGVSRVEFTRKDGTPGLMIPDVFRLGSLKPGGYEIQLRFLDGASMDIAPLVVTQVEVVLPFVKLLTPEIQTARKAAEWQVELPDVFLLGRDGNLFLYTSERMDPFVFSHSPSSGTLLVSANFSLPGKFSAFAILVGRGPDYRNSKRVLAQSELKIVTCVVEDDFYRDGKDQSRTKLVDWMFGPQFLILRNDMVVGHSVEHYGVWCLSEIELFKSIYDSIAGNSLNSSLFFLDIGANIGSFAVPIGQHLGQRGRVLAIEAHPQTFQVLTANVALAGIDNVDTFNYVAGSETEERKPSSETQNRPNNVGAHSFDSGCLKCISHLWGVSIFDEILEDLSSLPKQIWRTMDEIIEENYQSDFGRIAVVKIDVEGFEVDVMLGFRKTVSKHRPVIFFEANRDDKIDELMDIFDELGYSLFWSKHLLHQDKAPRNADKNIFSNDYSSNILAIPKEKLEEFRNNPKLASSLAEELRVLRNESYRDVAGSLAHLVANALPQSEFGLTSPNGEDGLLFTLFMKICARSRAYVELVGPSQMDPAYQPGSVTSLLIHFFKFDGNIVEVNTPAFYRLREHRGFDLVVALHEAVGVDHLCALLCNGSCLNGLCHSEQQRMAASKPRVILLRSAAASSTHSRCVDSESVATSRARALKTFAESIGYKVIYCESNGQSCILMSREALFWGMIPTDTQLAIETAFFTPEKLVQSALHRQINECVENVAKQ